MGCSVAEHIEYAQRVAEPNSTINVPSVNNSTADEKAQDSHLLPDEILTCRLAKFIFLQLQFLIRCLYFFIFFYFYNLSFQLYGILFTPFSYLIITLFHYIKLYSL